jgi:alpha-tubulin suppressor-like RCC1 family protein
MNVMKKFFIGIAIVSIVGIKSQVGINSVDPQGILHMKNTNSAKQMGVVMPIVDSASVTLTPTSTTPVEATVVYDNTSKCLKLKRDETWTDCLLDKAGVSSVVNQILGGGNSGISITAIKSAAGDYFNNLFISRDDNYVYGMGYSALRSLAKADGPSKPSIILAKPAVDISAGYANGLAILKNGELWAWGSNAYGSLGFNPATTVDALAVYNPVGLPTKVLLPSGVLAAKVKTFYNSHTFMLGQDGLLYASGYNGNYRTGLNTNTGSTVQFTVIPFFKNLKTSTGVTVIDFDGQGGNNGGIGQGVAVTSNGKLYVWGNSNATIKNLASSTLNGDIQIPTDVTANFNLLAGEKIVRCIIDGYQGLVLTNQDRLFGFGYNYLGALGLSSTTNYILPTELVIPNRATDGTEVIVDLAMDTNSTIVATKRNVYATGYPGGLSVLGVGNNNILYKFTKMAFSTIVPTTYSYGQIDISNYFSIIITGAPTSDGGSKVYGAGYGYYNALGGSVISPTNIPENITY